MKTDLKKTGFEVDLSGTRQGLMKCSCGHGNEYSGSINDVDFLD